MPKAPKASVNQNKVLHPNSRKAMCIQRQANRENRVMKVKAETALKQEQLQQKLLWFQHQMDPQKTTYTKDELAQLTRKYLDRFKDELEQISIVHNVGNRQSKQHQARESAIKITEEKEMHEFNTVGIDVPDLVNGKVLEYFKNWTGETRYLPNIKLRRSKETDLKQSEENEEDSEKSKTKDTLAEKQDPETEELPDYVEPDSE